jgi:hypothetical protein
MAVVGASLYSAQPASAAALTITSAKVCVPFTTGFQNCTLTDTFSAATTGADTLTVTASAGTFVAVTATGAPAACAPVAGAPAGATVTIAVPAGCTGVTVQEFIQAVPAGTTSITQTSLLAGADTGTGTATAALADLIPVGAQKSCTPTAANSAVCTITLPAATNLAAGTTTITVTGPAGTTVSAASATGGTPAITAAPGATAGPVTITCPAVAPAQCTGPATITETLSGAALVAGVTVTEAVSGASTGALPTVTLGGVPGAPFQTTIVSQGCQSGTAFTTGNALTTSINPGGTITCRFKLGDNEPGTIPAGTCLDAPTVTSASQCVSSGLVTVTLNTPTAGLSIAGSPTANTVTVRCPPTGSGLNACDPIDVTFNTTASAVLTNAVSVQIVYNPDSPAQNTTAVANFTSLFSIVQGVSAFTQPVGLLIACTSTVAGPFTGPVPGPIGNINIIAVGVLPGTLPCTVTPVNAAGVATPAAPGTIEVSSVAGVLLTSAGQLATNLRIACDTAPTVTIGVTINVNTCLGVAFAVLGTQVGPVDLRARYEPNTVAAAAGITEIEASTNVAFVAPPVSVSLLLSPNPVVVGQTGTATARFNRSFNCSAAFGFGTGAVLGGNVCIDPTTGLPIAFDFGSGLNGSVIFTIDNSVVASWVSPTAPSVAPVSAPQVTGFVATANQTVVRCGFFPTTGFPVTNVTIPTPSLTGPLANFFGGCDSAAATYKGLNAGNANVNATFVPDLPGAFGSTTVGLSPAVTPLLGLFSNTQPTQTRVLNVVAAPPSGTTALVRGCNNVTPTVSESATAYAARVTPAGALVAIWEHQAATNTFKGFSPQAGAPNDLSAVTRLKPVFVCVNAAASLDQPPA